MKKKGSFDDTRPFNSSLAFLERLERRWEDCSEAKITGELIKYHRCLHVIYMDTHIFFDDIERAKCTQYLDESSQELNNAGLVNNTDAQIMIFTDFEKMLDQWHMYLATLLFKYKITYVQIEKYSWQDEVKADFR